MIEKRDIWSWLKSEVFGNGWKARYLVMAEKRDIWSWL